MPYKDPIVRKEYHRNYSKTYVMNDEQKKHKAEYQKEFHKTYKKDRSKYHKSDTIYNWKKRGLIETDDYTYDSLYDCYMTTTDCQLCEVELTIDKKRTSTTKCMDHSHETNIFRNIVCHSCNMKQR